MTALGPSPTTAQVDGPTLFARFAFPPNALGLCGPSDTTAVFEYAASGVVDAGLRELAHGFEGAWPYLELLAGEAGVADPLDARVVSTYWLGGPLADWIPLASVGRSLDERFRLRAGTRWEHLVDALGCGLGLCHGFHVFAVYPWVGLLRSGMRARAVEVLDRCRIRPAQVVAVEGDTAVVRSRPLVDRDGHLVIGEPESETVQVGDGGLTLGGRPPRPGQLVACHWDWVCGPIDSAQSARLGRDTVRQVAFADAHGALGDP